MWKIGRITSCTSVPGGVSAGMSMDFGRLREVFATLLTVAATQSEPGPLIKRCREELGRLVEGGDRFIVAQLGLECLTFEQLGDPLEGAR
jgi:hypothetical protein